MSAPSTHNQPTSAQPETEKFLAWYAAEKQKGLMDIKFFTKDISMASVESFCADFNKLESAKVIDDPDFI